MADFRGYNFIIVANLEKLKIHQGILRLRLKYKSVQDNKHALLWTPIYEKSVVIDRNLDVTVE